MSCWPTLTCWPRTGWNFLSVFGSTEQPRLVRGAFQQSTIDAYTRKTLLHTWLDEKRRPWRRREQLAEELPELPDPAEFAVVSRAQLLDLLDGLPPRRRAAVVLRLYLDLSVTDQGGGAPTANALPLTFDQLVAIGTDPALTLFP